MPDDIPQLWDLPAAPMPMPKQVIEPKVGILALLSLRALGRARILRFFRV